MLNIEGVTSEILQDGSAGCKLKGLKIQFSGYYRKGIATNTTTTDDTGHYQIQLPMEGAYMLEVANPDYVIFRPKMCFLGESYPSKKSSTLNVYVKKREQYPPPLSSIYLVRCAEYDYDSSNSYQNVSLNDTGRYRARQLADTLSPINLAAIYLTTYNRTVETAQFLSCKNLIYKEYTDSQGIADDIKKNYMGKNVLVIGHLDTLPTTIRLLAPASPTVTIGSEDFHRIFTVPNDGTSSRYTERQYPPFPSPKLQVTSISNCTCVPPSASIYLIRHADYDGGTDDPLNAKGLYRAQQLGMIMDHANLAAVFHTVLRRSIDTAAKLSCSNKIQYSSSQLLVDQIKSNYGGKNVLIVGHSNTIPEILNLLVHASSNVVIGPYDFHRIFIIPNDGSSNSFSEVHYSPFPTSDLGVSAITDCNCAAVIVLKQK